MPGRNSPCVITCDPHAAAMMDQKCDGGGGGVAAATAGVGGGGVGGLMSYNRGRGGTEVIIKPRSPAVVQVATGGGYHGLPTASDAVIVRSPPGGHLPGPQQQAPPSRNGCSTLFSDIAGVKRLRPDDWLAVNSPPASSPGTSHISYTVISNGGSGGGGGGGGYSTSPMSTNSYDPYSPMSGKIGECLYINYMQFFEILSR